MNDSQDRIDALIAAPTESLNVELKRWVDPRTPHGQAKIAIGCIALRNRNGGYLVVGFDDRTALPDDEHRPDNVEGLFHPDIVQHIVSQFASQLFEVKVRLAARDGLRYPVIVVEAGVTVPVAAKRELIDGNKTLIRQDAVYFRTLRSNGVVSSSAATHGDWADIINICFENREADIGRFLRRHLGPNAPLIGGLKSIDPDTNLRGRAAAILRHGDARREKVFNSDEFRDRAQRYSKIGAWSAALVFEPARQEDDSDRPFLQLISAANPQLTGAAPWTDTRGMGQENRPRKKDGAWETITLEKQPSFIDQAEFQWVHARGEFYLWRAYQDDLSQKVEPGTALDLGLLAYRFAETIAVGLKFAAALEVAPETRLGFLFRAAGLSGRMAQTWANPERYLPVRGRAFDEEAEGFTALTADTPATAIAPYLQQVLSPIAGAFDGSVVTTTMLETYVERLLSGRL
ncbi:hypothetical protein NOJ05_19610 [Neorhizobium galegae]|uniref:AlbA family DNA-binding domain-containing protein n=1 Tax=Neorhizobium galegae TaxID=399 RepID=UPI0021072B7E|nr:hypothetical protein [Neorhizobium galegae]MCQ1779419.1 hypothetical protein [Neorhizobium galegae]MCQ1795579.1 hypothetical protein [Neorhizobium galegae]